MLTRTEKRTLAQPPSPEPLVVWLRIGRVPVRLPMLKKLLRVPSNAGNSIASSPLLEACSKSTQPSLMGLSGTLSSKMSSLLSSQTETSKVSLSPFSPPTFMVPTLPWSGANTVLGKTVNDPRFKLVAEHRVTKLILSQVKPGVVAGVLVRDLKADDDYLVKVYIITCGSICTPQILHNSGLRPYALGRYLTEQSMAFCQIVLSKIHIV
ncbi:hypothetical protein EV361DRAFT_572781 [Lentinula raphanica]|nr:hypothetical protein EV361DRAFT_572781 [Lentinula raphanica]